MVGEWSYTRGDANVEPLFIIDAFDGHNIYTFEIKDPLVDEVSYQVYAEKNYKGEGSVYIRKKVNLKSVEE